MDASLDLERTLDAAARLLVREHAVACRIVLTGSDWEPRRLPALIAERDGEEELAAINDLVLVRAAAGQVILEVELDGV
jgi:hypothetical protein